MKTTHKSRTTVERIDNVDVEKTQQATIYSGENSNVTVTVTIVDNDPNIISAKLIKLLIPLAIQFIQKAEYPNQTSLFPVNVETGEIAEA